MNEDGPLSKNRLCRPRQILDRDLTMNSMAISSAGLALSAGGARGAYQIGAWKAFLEKGLRFEAFSGSSIGALNSALICQGNWEKAYRLWMEIPEISIIKPDVARFTKLMFTMATDIGLMLLPIPNIRLIKFLRPFFVEIKIVSRHGTAGSLARDGLIDMRSFEPFISQFLDIKAIFSSDFPVFVCVYETPSLTNPLGATRFFRLQDLAEDEAWLVLAASASLPFIFSTIHIDKARHTDGGIGSWLPLEPLLESNVKNIIAVCSKHGSKSQRPTSKTQGLTILQPSRPLGRFPIATFGFRRHNIERWMELGYTDTRQKLTLF